MVRNRDMTKHKHLFDNYWGNANITAAPEKAVFQKRNTFVYKYGIVKQDKTKTVASTLGALVIKYGRDTFDHVEAYRDRSGQIVVLISPYEEREPNKDLIKKMNFRRAPTLYAKGALSFIAVYTDIYDLKRTAKPLL